ncbi:prepilin peptidase [Candidatus Uhrbacteria bacterium]|nr:prepilin peptidase [Candidatus Uhrbacteria bacterium]
MLPLLGLLLGAGIGSFINVLAARTVAGKSIILPRSFCDVCAKPLWSRDMIPVVSFFLRRARCRFCRAKISWQYPVIEGATAVLFALAAVRVGNFDWQLLAYWVAITALVALFLTDLRAMVLPDRITIPAIVVLLAIDLFALKYSIVTLGSAILVGAGFFLAQYLLSRGTWVGSGDIRMGLLMAAALRSPLKVGLAIMIAYVVGAAIALFLVATRKKSLKSEIPLGTFLAIGTIAALLFV